MPCSLVILSALFLLVHLVSSQVVDLSSFPHSYSGIPNSRGLYNSANSRQWQRYYRVNPAALPNSTHCLMPSGFAGNIPVNRPNQLNNNTLFFWAFENKPGSLLNEVSHDPWIVWLNGGPGSSSSLGLAFEHGPCLIGGDDSLRPNEFSLHTVTDVVYIDQPVGVGFATADPDGFIEDEDQMSEDFVGFLSNLVEVFPSLRTRPLYIMGESYAGTYIPYIMKKYFQIRNPPVKINHMVIGDGGIGVSQQYQHSTVLSTIETYPQTISYDTDVYQYFIEQTHLCGYDVHLTFPQVNALPSLRPSWIDTEDDLSVQKRRVEKGVKKGGARHALMRLVKGWQALEKRDTERAERENQFRRAVSGLKTTSGYIPLSRRDLSGRANGTIDEWYQCGLLWELIDYAVNFTSPWNQIAPDDFDYYYVRDALSPKVSQDVSGFFNDPRTVAILHAPQSRPWVPSIDYPFGNVEDPPSTPNNDYGDPSPAPVSFLSELATNSSKHGIPWTFLSAQGDALSGPMPTLMVIQNTTFGGIRGFTQAPSTAWYGPNGGVAGVVHQERNVTFILFQEAGHQIPIWQPRNYIGALREFVFGQNRNGSLDTHDRVIGTPFALSQALNIPGENDAIFTGLGATLGSTAWPTATIASWNKALGLLMSPTPAI